MLDLWVPITIGAAFFQNLRSVLQKRLTGQLSVGGATFTRFAFGVPLVALYVLVLHQAGEPWPQAQSEFLPAAIIGGLAQIAGTFLLVGLFQRRNFAVGNAFSKTETVQAALFGAVLLSEVVSFWAGVGIGVGLVGILVLSVPPGGVGRFDPVAVLMGIGSGAAFGVAAVAVRMGSLALDGTGFAMQAGLCLMLVIGFQTLALAAYLALFERGELTRIAQRWRTVFMVSAVGVMSSIGWFTAMALENAALVRAVGQIELIFSILSAALLFGERFKTREFLGIALVGGSILLIVLAA